MITKKLIPSLSILFCFMLISGCGRGSSQTLPPTETAVLPTETVALAAVDTATTVPPTEEAEPTATEVAATRPTEVPVEEPAAEQPVAETEQPAVEQPAAEQPAVEQPAVEQPAAEQSAVEQPAAEQPAAEQPAVEQPTAEQSAVEQPAVEQPAAIGDDNMMGIAALSIGTPGRYVNVAYGHVATYPESWFTGFGNRPILASFSNLDPGTTNRDIMRETGCLFETNVSPNIYGATLSTMMAQAPQTYENAESTTVGGKEAVRLRFDNPNRPYINETIQIVEDGRQFTLTADMSRNALDTCQPAWSDFLNNWSWFTADFTTYRNTNFGYAYSHPRSWLATVFFDRGEIVSSQEVVGDVSLEDLARTGMVIHTDVLENPELLTLKQWILANVPNAGLTNDIQLDSLVGVRSITEWPNGTQKMIGYFQGPLGKIYVVSSSYPLDRQREFRPIANAVLYSFSF